MEFKEFDNLENKEFVYFNGKKYCRMGGKRKYFLSYATKNKERKKPKGLHIAIWEYYNNKDVPKGMCIHHKDGNSFNNNPNNLELLSYREHCKHHPAKDKEKQKLHLHKIQDMAKEWHKSIEGKEWHKKIAKKNMEKRREKRVCKECYTEYEHCGNTRKEDINDGRYCKKCERRLWHRGYRKFKRGEITSLQFKGYWRSLFC